MDDLIDPINPTKKSWVVSDAMMPMIGFRLEGGLIEAFDYISLWRIRDYPNHLELHFSSVVVTLHMTDVVDKERRKSLFMELLEHRIKFVEVGDLIESIIVKENKEADEEDLDALEDISTSEE